MKRLIPLLAFLALAAAQNLSLETALGKAASQAPVVSAKAELDDAQAALQRVLADPLLTRPGRVQAEQRVALAQASYTRALRQAEGSIAGAYAQVLEANLQNRLAQQSLKLAETNLQVAQIRQKNGSGTALDVKNAQNRLEDARRQAGLAESGFALAQSNLRSLVGAFAALDPLAKLPEPPGPEAVKGYLEANPDLLQARQRAELARLQVELLDPSYAARADIDAARARTEQAQAGAREVERALALQYDQLYNQLVSASRALGVSRAAVENAREQLAADRKRLEGGLISPIAYAQSELALTQAELAAQQAVGNYLRAYYNLLTGGGR